MKNGMHEDEWGTKKWYKNNQLHRLDGPALERPDGYKAWFKNNQLHREDGPACEWANGGKEWFKNNQLHREDGPAVEYASGTKFWHLNGTFYSSFDEWLEVLDATDEDKLFLKLKWV